MSVRKNFCAIALTLGTWLAAPAHAVILSSVTAAPGDIVTDFSAPGALSFDLDLANSNSPTTLTYEIETGDGAQLSLNAIVRNLLGGGIGFVELSLTNAAFSLLGSAERAFGPAPTVSGGASAGVISFAPPEFFEFFVGDPTATGSGTDWLINIAGLNPGDRFSLRVAVAEPATPALLLAGLALAIGLARRRV
ncbi:MAG: hypothetical protein FJY56_06640 [Betaproteobacteria bacterium]|nr:hypothetical protein [Betaproteobacteria bacterium]